MADLREDFVNYIVKALVTNPDAVDLRRATDEKGEYLELKVDPADMGKVIGKAGATAKSIRTLLRGVGAKDNLAPLPLKIVDPEGYDGPAAPPAAEAPPVDEPTAEQPSAEQQPVEEVAAEPAAEEPNDSHERTRREAEELADLEL
jgi:predicted RNA-binding protein YlqC (UPF0109 family)